ncbi:MAG: GGDEF domain-containing protein [Veillonellaceae bacterium]|nr:GGDEF domain-containing protein [Veillonellaceae bacterium]
MLDLDDFKSVNDTYGHTAGDAVLKGLGQAILDSIRKADCFFRWGGDKFFLVLQNTPREGAGKLYRARRMGKNCVSDQGLPGARRRGAECGEGSFRGRFSKSPSRGMPRRSRWSIPRGSR